MVRILKSIPIVVMKLGVKLSSLKRSKQHDFPTPESPIRSSFICTKKQDPRQHSSPLSSVSLCLSFSLPQLSTSWRNNSSSYASMSSLFRLLSPRMHKRMCVPESRSSLSRPFCEIGECVSERSRRVVVECGRGRGRIRMIELCNRGGEATLSVESGYGIFWVGCVGGWSVGGGCCRLRRER